MHCIIWAATLTASPSPTIDSFPWSRLGPCINNSDLDPPHEKAAYEAEQKAL